MNDPLGDRLKQYEDSTRLMPGLPVFARLDGKNFHRWTKGLDKPFDAWVSKAFIDAAHEIAVKTNANMAYTQSDEVTLCWYGNTIPFDGKVQKMVSVLASMFTETFYRVNGGSPAHFDCRVFSVPNTLEGVEVFRWRQLDASKNSVSMAARSEYSHKQLNGKSSKEMREMLLAKGVNWNTYPEFFRYGTFIQRHKVLRKFESGEIDKLPPKHEARVNPELMVERYQYRPITTKLGLVHNLLGFIFEGEEPNTTLSKYPECVKEGCPVHPYVL